MQVAKLQRASLHDPVKVEVCNKYQTVDKLLQFYLFIPAREKVPFLKENFIVLCVFLKFKIMLKCYGDKH